MLCGRVGVTGRGGDPDGTVGDFSATVLAVSSESVGVVIGLVDIVRVMKVWSPWTRQAAGNVVD